MSQFDILKEKILNYFPPVDIKIQTYEHLIYEETTHSYEKYFAIIPLKHLINEDIYAPEIIKTLQTFRILLRSNLDNNRFIYELNLLVSNWGKGGYYQKNIIKQDLTDLIKKINIVFINEEAEKEREKERKKEREKEREREKELIKYAEEVSINYKLNDINNYLLNLKLKNNFTKIPGRSRCTIYKNKQKNKDKILKNNVVCKECDNDIGNNDIGNNDKSTSDLGLSQLKIN